MKITRVDAVRVRIPQKPPIAPYQSRYRAGTHNVPEGPGLGVQVDEAKVAKYRV